MGNMSLEVKLLWLLAEQLKNVFSKRERERWGRLSKMKRGNRYMHRDSPKNTQKKLFKNQCGEFLVESKKKEI